LSYASVTKSRETILRFQRT